MSAANRRRLSEAEGPLYHSIAGLLRNDILLGRLAGGERIPTIDHLAAEFGVAKVTVRQAIAVLVEEGLLTSQQGRGTFVTAQLKKVQKVRLESNWNQLLFMLEGNRPHLIEILESTSELPAIDTDGVSTGDYRFMRRIHLQGKRPYCVLDIYLDRETYLKRSEAFDTEMVIPNLQRVPDLRVRTMKQTFQIASADLELSARLDIPPNAPIGLVRRVLADTEGRIIYLGIGSYRGDDVVFETTIEIPPAKRDSRA